MKTFVSFDPTKPFWNSYITFWIEGKSLYQRTGQGDDTFREEGGGVRGGVKCDYVVHGVGGSSGEGKSGRIFIENHSIESELRGIGVESGLH